MLGERQPVSQACVREPHLDREDGETDPRQDA